MTDHAPLAVVLAAGESSRLWPLGEKSLLRFFGETLLARQLRALRAAGFSRLVVVCNAANEALIRTTLAAEADVPHFETTLQGSGKGMGAALLSARGALSGGGSAAYVTQAHDVIDPTFHADVMALHRARPEASLIAAQHRTDDFPGGWLVTDPASDPSLPRISGVIEKPPPELIPPDRLVNIVAHLHADASAFLEAIDDEYRGPQDSDDHYERAMTRMAASGPYHALRYEGPWSAVKFPWHVLGVMRQLFRTDPRLASGSVAGDTASARIEDGAHISGAVYLGGNNRILRGADIRGPVYLGRGVLVGQWAQVRELMVGEESIVGIRAEVNRSYVGARTNMHAAMALDSVVADSPPGQAVNLSANSVTLNLRADAGRIFSMVKGNRTDTGESKLGAIIGAGVFVGGAVLTNPGIKIGAGARIMPAVELRSDVPDATEVLSVQTQTRRPRRDQPAGGPAGAGH